MIRPTVGRVVWYWPAAIKGKDDRQPKAAIIAFVHSDEEVNLAVFDSDGETYPQEHVVLWHGEGETPNRPHAEWMPYQKGQAAKTEELERTVREGFTKP
jgi:hypothetical protein